MGASRMNSQLCKTAVSRSLMRPSTLTKDPRFLFSAIQHNLICSSCLHFRLQGHSLKMWSLFYYEVLCCLLPTFAVSLALAPQTPDGSLTLTNLSSLPPSLNVSSPTAFTRLTAPAVACDEGLYGRVRLDSCKDAFNQIPHDPATLLNSRVLSYGPRDHGSWDAILPKRYISCEPSFFFYIKG